MKTVIAGIAVTVATFLAGCQVGPGATLSERGISSKNNPATLAAWDDKDWNLVSPLGANQMVADEAGLNKQTTHISTTLTLSLGVDAEGKPKVVATMDDPSQRTLTGLDVTIREDGTYSLKIESLTNDIGATLSAIERQVLAYNQTVGIITAEQRAAIEAQVAAGASFAEAAIDVAGRALLPLP